MALIKIVLCLCLVHLVAGKGSEAQIQCTPEYMKVSVPMDGDRKISYLDQLKDYAPCEPTMEGNSATFMLDLQDYHKCAVMRVLNKITGTRTYYHKVVIEDASGARDTVRVRCVVPSKLKALAKRAVEPFPVDFNEPEDLNITRYMEGRAPEPILGAVVKQNGKQVSGEISVSPGTPLSMEIFLDNSSAPVYGLLVNYMHVTDTGKQQETIIFNGCSVDPYLFDNFLTSDGNNLTARFRAFKFPDTSYVLFKGTVTVCLDTCQGVQCSNGVTAYGRRKRAIAAGSDANKVYEVSLTTIIKVDWADGKREEEDVLTLLKNFKAANQKLGDDDATVAQTGHRRLTHSNSSYYAPCEPTIEGNSATFMLDLQDYHKCAVMRVLNKITGTRTYYHKVVIEDASGARDTVRVRCVVPSKLKALAKRAVEPFPVDFNEPEDLNITRYMEGRAPEPILGAVVKQNGKQVSGEISVSPGTPLSMEIFLDNSSAPVYGLLVNYMHVTDTGKQQETIIFNGCSVDPYLFDNFLTSDGNNLTARFRAFKFPDTSYVLFKGTVTVCLDTCQGVQCSNGVTAYGRRKRAIAAGSDANKVYEVSLTTIIKVDWADGKREEEDVLTLLKNFKAANQKLGDDDATVAQTGHRRLTHSNSSCNIHVPAFIVLIVSLFVLFK